MREGSREGVLVRKEEPAKVEAPKPVVPQVPEVKPRPMVVHGSTYQVETPMGQAYITINTNGGEQPLEVFVNVGKAGSDVTAMAEAMGRLISLTLRLASPITPMERAHRIAAELIGIGGARSLGFGENRIRSLPDAVAKVIDRHFGFFAKHRLSDAAATVSDGHAVPATNGAAPASAQTNGHAAATPAMPAVEAAESGATHPQQMFMTQNRMVTVDLCPSCGESTLVFEESCKKCYSCGFSEC
jgi:ribonucleoside-diphosphate reductase alpha chain